MKKNLQTTFSTRQYMLSEDFEIYYYSDTHDNDLRAKVRLHSHDYYEFYFFLEGNVSIQINDLTYPLKSGHMILILPNIPHQAVIHDTDRPYRRFVFWISKSFFHQLQKTSPDYTYFLKSAQSAGYYIFHYDLITFNALQSRIFQLIEEIHSNRFGKETQISLYVQELILYLNRTIFEHEQTKSPEEEQRLYQSLMQYIETHLEKDLSLDQLAREFYVSKYHIAHVFKENIGLSVHQFIIKKRLYMCRDSILGGQEISKTYLLFGFKDYSSFFRAFKKEFGMSPKEYQELFLSPISSSVISYNKCTDKTCGEL